jgi:hypothetical protein
MAFHNSQGRLLDIVCVLVDCNIGIVVVFVVIGCLGGVVNIAGSVLRLINFGLRENMI